MDTTLDDLLDELFGLHPSSWVIVQQSIETVLSLVHSGNVVLVGWGANVITSKLPNVFHVRLVGSLEQRIARIQDREHLNRKQALAFIMHQDRGRERYVRRYFSQQLSDTQFYHLIINTDRFSENDVARLIADTALVSYPDQRAYAACKAH
jgi:cytidylate kinase